MNEIISNFKIELKRGSLVILVLHFLREKAYGYSLLQDLVKYDIPIEAGTLYPLLRRLEKQGLLKSDWDTTDVRPRKYYYLSNEGFEVYEELKKEWHQLSQKMNDLL